MKYLALIFAGMLLVVVACGGEGKLGESCDDTGKTEGECESGGVCGVNTGTALVCLKVCTEQTDCPADQECNGVSGTSTKGCRLKSTTGSSGGPDAGKK